MSRVSGPRVPQQQLKQIFKNTWTPLKQSLDEINEFLRSGKEPPKRNCATKIGSYTLIYDAVTRDQSLAQMMYLELGKWLKGDLELHVTKTAVDLANRNESEKLFRFIGTSFSNFKVLCRFAKLVFRYLDQYLTQRQNHDDLSTMFLKAFNDAVYDKVKKQLMEVIIRIVNNGRRGNRIDREGLKNAVNIFNTVGVASATSEDEANTKYIADFEKFYVSAIEVFYKGAAATRLSSEGGHYTYLEWTDARFQFEETLARELLREPSIPKVGDALVKLLLNDQHKRVIRHPDSGFKVLLTDNKDDDARRMYRLMKRVPDETALSVMSAELLDHILAEGEAIVKNFAETSPTVAQSAALRAFIEAALGLWDRHMDTFNKLFESSVVFQKALKAAFDKFLNVPLARTEQVGDRAIEHKTTVPEVLAAYVDSVMRREFKDITDPEQELERLDKLATLFSHLKEKDVFQEFHKAKLAKRLLQTTPAEELEKAFLEKLQRLMGKSFTHKMEGMLNDRDATKKMSDQFQGDALAQRLGRVGFEVQILTAGHWPAYKTDALEPAGSLRECITAFTLFYKRAHATRTLSWIHMLGTAALSVAFPRGVKEVSASTYQACILTLVDQAADGALTVAEIAAAMKLDAARVVKPQIASMYLSKQFPLLCLVDAAGAPQATGRGIGDGDRLALNRAFTHKMRKFKLPLPTTAAKEGMPTDPELEARRRIQVDACIVRVMKSRRALHHVELQDVVIAQLSRLFTPQPRLIKQRVEDLITRGYLKRDPDDPARFEYLA